MITLNVIIITPPFTRTEKKNPPPGHSLQRVFKFPPPGASSQIYHEMTFQKRFLNDSIMNIYDFSPEIRW